jgi:hypothetical protein
MLSGMKTRFRTGEGRGANWLLVCSGVLLLACAAPAQVESPAMTVKGPPSLQSVVEAVLNDAVKVTGRDRDALDVLSAESVTWPDGSLGCPQPELMYTQALVPGFRVRIKAGERVLDYHASQQGRWILCPAHASQDPVPGAATS